MYKTRSNKPGERNNHIHPIEQSLAVNARGRRCKTVGSYMLLNQQIPGQIPHNRATSKHHDKQDMRIQYGTQLQAANGGNQPIWPAAQGNYTQLRCSVLIHYMLFPSFTFHSITDNPPLISSSFNFIQHFKISNPIIALLTNFYIITSLPNVNHSTKTALLYIYDHLINANGSLKISRPFLLVPVCCL